MKIKTIGFPRMLSDIEKGEKRDFLPDLMGYFKKIPDVEVYLENNYGEGMGLCENDYLKLNPNIKFVDHETIYKKDMVIVLKSPTKEEIYSMKKGAVLMSMMHFETRPTRNTYLLDQKLEVYSMDSMADDKGNRMLVNYNGTSRSAVKTGFYELQKRMKNFYSKKRGPIKATIIGMGGVGLNAARAFEEFSDKEFLYNNEEVLGVTVTMLPRGITKDLDYMKEIMKETDIFVDATKRPDTSISIIPNSLLAHAPAHMVIVDISADPYNEKVDPILIKAIEGIPTGSLNKYVFEIDEYAGIPDNIDSTNKRVVVSCSGWPGVDPINCMEVYNDQIKGYIKELLTKDTNLLDIKSEEIYERSLVRSSLKYFLEQQI